MGRYRKSHVDVNRKMRTEYHNCMKKLKDRTYCKYKINKDKHRLMKQYHENNWKYNILRWNKKLGRSSYRKRLKEIRERRRNWRRHPKDLRREIEAFRNKWSRENKDKYDDLTQKLESRLRDMNTYHGWKTYQRQQQLWERTPVGGCLKARIVHYEDMKRKWGRMNGSQKHHSSDHLHRACHKARQSWLPFGNKGCMNELDKEYGAMLDAEKRLANNEKALDNHIKHIAMRTEHIFTHKCQNWTFKHKAPHCENYLRHKLHADAKKIHREFKNDIDNRWMRKIITNYEEIYDTLMDERFWLNAPHDCHIGKHSAPIEEEQHGIMKWLNALRKRKWSHEKFNHWKGRGRWRRRHWRWRRNHHHGRRHHGHHHHRRNRHHHSRRHHHKRNNDGWN